MTTTTDLTARPYKSRIRRPKQHSSLLDSLTMEPNSIFQTYRDCLVFAASLGCTRNTRIPFSATDEPIAWATFEDFEPLFNLFALFREDDVSIIGRERFGEQLTIFEEFANGGLELIQQEVTKKNGDTIEALIGLLMKGALEQADSQGTSDVGSILAALVTKKAPD